MSEKPDGEAISRSALGEELDRQEAAVLATAMGVRHLGGGELLTPEGGDAHTLFLLVKGKVGVYGKDGEQERVLYEMKEGECAGTRAFIDRTPRKATLRAMGEATVYTMEPDAFEALLDRYPRIVYKVMRALFRITHSNLMRMNVESQEMANYITKTRGRY